MSQVNADTIRKSDGSLGTDIRIKNTSVYESDGGTSVTQNLVQGLAKSWINFNGTGTPASRDSFNIASITDTGTGHYDPQFSNNMSNNDFSATGGLSASGVGGEPTMILGDGYTTSSVKVLTDNELTSTDMMFIAVTVHGDLA